MINKAFLNDKYKFFWGSVKFCINLNISEL